MSNYVPIKHAYDTHEPESGADSKLSPIIFLHGIVACKEVWKDIPQKVANETKRKVYNVDIRNHGDSEWSDAFDFEVLKRDVLHFMKTINCQKAVFISHSLGARIAIQMALENPEKVETIIVEEMMLRKVKTHLLGFPVAFTSLGPSIVSKIPKEANEDEAARFVLETVCDNILVDKAKRDKLVQMDKTTVGLKKTVDGYAFKANMAVLARTAKNSQNILIEPKGRFEGPVLFIYGNSSPYEIYKEIDHIKEQFPNAEFSGIDDAMHCVHHDKPKEFYDAILKFLQKQIS